MAGLECHFENQCSRRNCGSVMEIPEGKADGNRPSLSAKKTAQPFGLAVCSSTKGSDPNTSLLLSLFLSTGHTVNKNPCLNKKLMYSSL